MTCNPPSSNGHKYIVVVVDYFTKWVEAMPIFNNTIDTIACFFFNHVISFFGVPLQLVYDHGKHFKNEIFVKLSSRLGFSHEFSSPYYLSPTDMSKQLTRSSRPCYNAWLTNIRPIGIICYFPRYGISVRL
jgi:hypothetical protein